MPLQQLINPGLASLTWSFFKQSSLKQLLTEGKFLLYLSLDFIYSNKKLKHKLKMLSKILYLRYRLVDAISFAKNIGIILVSPANFNYTHQELIQNLILIIYTRIFQERGML